MFAGTVDGSNLVRAPPRPVLNAENMRTQPGERSTNESAGDHQRDGGR